MDVMKTFLSTITALAVLGVSAAAQTAPPQQRQPGGSSSGGASTSNGKPAAGAPDLSPDYRLVPGDKLRVEVYKDAQVSQSVQVRPDGKITLPLVNDLMAAGRTPIELRDAIAEALKPYIANPTVTVIVVETVPPVIYVMGEVNSSGPQALVGRMDVIQALSAAGGFKDFANTKKIKIRRGSDILSFNYNEAMEGKAPPVLLRPGDTIIVP
jgi:polysaccharide biosynthesis/export protein